MYCSYSPLQLYYERLPLTGNNLCTCAYNVDRAGWFAKRMGLPIDKLIIATNENDILDRFFKSGGHYTKRPVHGKDANGGIVEDGAKAHSDGVKETLSPAMDILVSSNFERLLWFYSSQVGKSTDERSKVAGQQIKTWLERLKSNGGFSVGQEVLEAAKADFESERVSDKETTMTIRETYKSYFPRNTNSIGSKTGGYILDPHSAVGVAAALRSIERNADASHISLATAHAAKFSNAVDLALRGEEGYDFNEVLPKEFIGLEDKERRVTLVPSGTGWEGVREIVKKAVERELLGETT